MKKFWSLIKSRIFGIYHYASPKHLHGYYNEFSYRSNTRNTGDAERFTMFLAKVDERLT